MASLSKRQGPWLAFNRSWFNKHQGILLSWLNGSWLKRKLSRHALRISAVEPIIEIGPAHYIVKIDDIQRRADLRTRPKYAKRIYYSLIAYWWFLHFLDWAFLDRFVPQYSFGFDTLTVKSGLDNSYLGCDGYVGRIVTAGTTLSNVLTGAGTTVLINGTAGGGSIITAHADSNKYTTCRRAGFAFDTSVLGVDVTISAAVFSVYSTDAYGYTTFDTIDNSVNIVEFTPSYPEQFYADDYSRFGSTIFSTLSFADYTVSNGLKDFSFNATGIAAINKTGFSTIGMRFGSDISGTGVTWKTVATAVTGVRYVDYTGTASDPYLTITYSAAAPAVYKPSAIIVG